MAAIAFDIGGVFKAAWFFFPGCLKPLAKSSIPRVVSFSLSLEKQNRTTPSAPAWALPHGALLDPAHFWESAFHFIGPKLHCADLPVAVFVSHVESIQQGHGLAVESSEWSTLLSALKIELRQSK